MSNIFFTSDTHYGHANIASVNSSKWSKGQRHYKSLQEMNEDLVKNINVLVKPEDTLYHLGDWSFGGIENIWKFRKQINCQDIHLILGNHDHHIENKTSLPNVHIRIGELDNKGNYIKFDGAAVYGMSPNQLDINSSSLFSSISHYKEIKINGRVYILSHYAHRVWHGSHKGWYHLYGHSHDSLEGEQWGRSMDVGIDSAIRILGKARPFSITEISDILDKRPIKFSDHHGPNTNI